MEKAILNDPATEFTHSIQFNLNANGVSAALGMQPDHFLCLRRGNAPTRLALRLSRACPRLSVGMGPESAKPPEPG
jgi:hypothetical protein